MRNAEFPQPQAVAAKLAAIASGRAPLLCKQFESLPRLAEVLWFVEWRRRQPGGVAAFAEDLVRHAGKAILPDSFWELQVDKLGRFSPDDAFLVWQKLPAWGRPKSSTEIVEIIDFVDSGLVASEAIAAECGLTKTQIESFRQWLTRDSCIAACAKALPGRLQALLADVFYCDDQPVPASASFRETNPTGSDCYRVMDNLPGLLIAYLDSHAANELSRIADTEITKQVFESLERAFETKSLILVTGYARYGKTESLRAWCDAYPGKARLVSTPAIGSERTFLARIAEAIGFYTDPSSSLANLREKVCFALRHGHLMLAFDESHFLIPPSYSQTTAPARLNFIRTEIVDAEIGCLLCATPQAHKDSLDKFMSKTKYAMEQWLGRFDKICRLPEKLSRDDMMKVARVRLPGISDQCAKLIVLRATQTDHFLHAIRSIGKAAFWIAKRDGRAAVTEADITQASDEFMGGVCDEIEDHLPESGAIVRLRRNTSTSGSITSGADPVRAITPKAAFPGREIRPIAAEKVADI